MHIEQTHSAVVALQVRPLLNSLNELYPGFDSWYINTVMPGLVAGKDVLLVARDGHQPVGIALGKRSQDETKLRCVRVVPDHQNSGLGLRLIDRMLEALECEKPHCTVAEELLHTYSRAFIKRYGFELNDVTKGAYRPGRLEYSFN